MSLVLEALRAPKPDSRENWRLAWLLAFELCRRFYRSHGIVPRVTTHDGLGYYGLMVDRVSCRVHGSPTSGESLGRLTMFGDVENWREPQSGRLALHQIHRPGQPVDESFVAATIDHLELPPLPPSSHLGCRHQRWGASYELCFEIAAIIAMRYGWDEIGIWNHPFDTDAPLREHDPDHTMTEHPGAFVFRFPDRDKEVLLRADGKLLRPDGSLDLWEAYMQGRSVGRLTDRVLLELAKPSRES